MDWALVTTPANCEHLVSLDLDRHGYRHWLFHRCVTRARRGRVVRLLRPAFPRYVLVPFGECWAIVRDVWRVLGVVHFGEQVARVGGDVVERLIERCGGGEVLPEAPARMPYAVGTRVHVGGEGLLSGHDAIFDCLAEDGRLRVLFAMMGKPVSYDVDRRDVSVCGRRGRPGRRHRKLIDG